MEYFQSLSIYPSCLPTHPSIQHVLSACSGAGGFIPYYRDWADPRSYLLAEMDAIGYVLYNKEGWGLRSKGDGDCGVGITWPI